MSTILYFHGYNSDGKETSEKIFDGVKNVYPDSEIKIISYSKFENADESYAEIHEQVRPYVGEDVLLVGSSLGGFWANYFATQYALRVVLINPCCSPSHSAKEIFDYSADSYRKYEYLCPSKILARYVVLGMKDTVTNPAETKHYFDGVTEFYADTNEGHRFKDFSLINSVIIQAMSYYYY
jgi:hypothetical protein